MKKKKMGKKQSNKNLDDLYNSIIKSKTIDMSINYSREESNQSSIKRNEIFIKKYVPDVNKEEFINRAEKAKNENTLLKNDEINIINNQGSDSSFNQLLSLQLLIQKHSGLKELCK